MEKKNYHQYWKMVNSAARIKAANKLGMWGRIVALIVASFASAIVSLALGGNAITNITVALVTVVLWLLLWAVVFLWYRAHEPVVIFTKQENIIQSFKDKYELNPIKVDIDLSESEHDEIIIRERGSSYRWSEQMTNRIVGIRVTNKEANIDFMNVSGCLTSLIRRNKDGSIDDLWKEATRNGSSMSWSGGGANEDGELSIKAGKDRILNIAEGIERDVVFLFQRLRYAQNNNGVYIFEIEITGKVFDNKPIEKHRQMFHIVFEKLDKTFFGGDDKPYGSTDTNPNTTSVVKGYQQYVNDSYRMLNIKKGTP